jgi:hypothetical protein
LFASAENLYRAAARCAHTEVRVFNDRFRLHALRILEHIATATTAGSTARARSIRYAQMSLPKLFALIEAAWGERQISNEQRSELHALIRRLEIEIDGSPSPAGPPSSSTPDTPPESDRLMAPEELVDSSELMERDSSPHDGPPPDDPDPKWSS